MSNTFLLLFILQTAVGIISWPLNTDRWVSVMICTAFISYAATNGVS